MRHTNPVQHCRRRPRTAEISCPILTQYRRHHRRQCDDFRARDDRYEQQYAI